ncbi:hypothetical protein [Thauera humireducens]|uniref:flagellar export protein FliJ n=1 Tax=Thauera humireducens TaxID=1134435 RepID=UPI00311EF2F9
MSNQFHLQLLLDLAQTRTDDAARRLGELVLRRDRTSRRLQMLEDYRHEYNERFVEAPAAGFSPTHGATTAPSSPSWTRQSSHSAGWSSSRVPRLR